MLPVTYIIVRSRTYLKDCLWLAGKTMEVQIKGDLWNKRFITVQVYWHCSPLFEKMLTYKQTERAFYFRIERFAAKRLLFMISLKWRVCSQAIFSLSRFSRFLCSRLNFRAITRSETLSTQASSILTNAFKKLGIPNSEEIMQMWGKKERKQKNRGKKISNVQNSMCYNKFILTWLRPAQINN